jgi:hypothetical protein
MLNFGKSTEEIISEELRKIFGENIPIKYSISYKFPRNKWHNYFIFNLKINDKYLHKIKYYSDRLKNFYGEYYCSIKKDTRKSVEYNYFVQIDVNYEKVIIRKQNIDFILKELEKF